MEKTVLLVVDVQTALVEKHPCKEGIIVRNIKKLIRECRKNQIEVAFVRHNDDIGEELEPGSSGWQIYHEIAPETGEKIFDKHFNSAFKDTGLHAYLSSNHIRHIILVGMQTEYCIDTTCRVAFELGYRLTIPCDTTATFDCELCSGEKLEKYYENKIWNNRFAAVLPVEEILSQIPG